MRARHSRPLPRFVIPSFAVVATLCLGQTGCTSEYIDSDRACIVATPTGGIPDEPGTLELAEGASLPIVVEIRCAADREPQGECRVDLDGNELVVTSEFELATDPNDACGESVQLECPSPTLPAGTYTLRYADAERTVTVPSTIATSEETCLTGHPR